MTAPKLTELQFRALDHYAHHEMTPLNGGTPERIEDTGTYLWADDAAAELGISEQAMGGVLTSLTNEGLARVHPPTKREPDGTFDFTDKGFAAWQAHRLCKANA